MAPSWRLALLALSLLTLFVDTNAQESPNKKPGTTTGRVTTLTRSTPTESPRIFSATIQSFPTGIVTRTLSSTAATGSQAVQTFYPILDSDITTSVSFTLNLNETDNFLAYCWYPVSVSASQTRLRHG
jgi:hypothetical protein